MEMQKSIEEPLQKSYRAHLVPKSLTHLVLAIWVVRARKKNQINFQHTLIIKKTRQIDAYARAFSM